MVVDRTLLTRMCVFIHTMHRITVVPATWASTSVWTETKNAAFLQHKSPLQTVMGLATSAHLGSEVHMHVKKLENSPTDQG